MQHPSFLLVKMSWEILCAIALGLAIAVNLISLLGVGGLVSQKGIVDELHIESIPPGVFFMVAWSVIGAYNVVMIVFAFIWPQPYIANIGGWFVAMMVLNVAWVILFSARVKELAHFVLWAYV